MNKKGILYIKVALALVIALLVAKVSTETLFVSQSPAIRPDLASTFQNRLNAFLGRPTTPVSSPDVAQIDPTVDLVNQLKPVSKGVDAAGIESASYTKIYVDEVEWKEFKQTLSNGEEITIRVPADSDEQPVTIDGLERVNAQ